MGSDEPTDLHDYDVRIVGVNLPEDMRTITIRLPDWFGDLAVFGSEQHSFVSCGQLGAKEALAAHLAFELWQPPRKWVDIRGQNLIVSFHEPNDRN